MRGSRRAGPLGVAGRRGLSGGFTGGGSRALALPRRPPPRGAALRPGAGLRCHYEDRCDARWGPDVRWGPEVA